MTKIATRCYSLVNTLSLAGNVYYVATMNAQFVAQLLRKLFLFYVKNSKIFFLKIKMSGLHLQEKSSSYMTKLDDSITIMSPIFIPRHTKGQIGIHLEGRIKPDARLNVRFTPGPNVLAIKLDWTLSGAILYFQVMKDTHINVGQGIGKLHWQPFEQPGKIQSYSKSIKFTT